MFLIPRPKLTQGINLPIVKARQFLRPEMPQTLLYISFAFTFFPYFLILRQYFPLSHEISNAKVI